MRANHRSNIKDVVVRYRSRELRLQSSMTLPGNLVALPCTIKALYVQESGALIIQTVVCDGEHYDLLELDNDDVAKFYDELREGIAQLDPEPMLEVQ